MDTPVISAKNVSKKFVLSHQRLPYETFRDTVTELIKKPFRSRRTRDQSTKEDFWALQDVSFDVQAGEVIGIIGPNGSGKSTLLKILSQITPPTAGEIHVRGHIASLLEVGTGFHPELTGRENIFLNGAILGIPKKDIVRKFNDIVEFSGVEKFLDTPVKRYSSGMYVRLAFSVAAHMDSDILLIDEVLAVGDAEFQKKCLDKMESITKKEGRTILFVSHNLVAVQKLCHRAILLDHGLVKYQGQTADVISKYVHDKSTPSRNEELRHRPNTGGVNFTNVIISNVQGSGAIHSDDRLKIILQYVGTSPQPITEARVVATVNSESSGQTVLRLDSDVAGESLIDPLPPQGQIVIETGPINLAEGKYLVNVDFLIQGTSLDHIIRAGEFEVETDIEKYGFKIKPDQTVCDYVLPYSFKQTS